MKTPFTRLLGGLISLLVVPPTLSLAQTADEVIAKHLEAIGQAKLLTKQQMTITGKTVTQRGEAPLTVYMKRPNLVRRNTEIMGQKMTMTAFDGKSGWRETPAFGPNPGGVQDLRAEEVERLRNGSMDSELHNYKANNLTVELAGKEEVDGNECYVLKVTRPRGAVTTYYIDAEAYVIAKTRSKAKANFGGNEMEIETETTFSDYQTFGGVTQAMRIERKSIGGQGGGGFGGGGFGGGNNITIYDKVDFDTPIDDAVFARPK